jgi:putative redox protein
VASLQLPELGERLTAESGWSVGVASLRGVGDSPGTFSIPGWKDDLTTVMNALLGERDHLALAGFGLGGALALRVAVEDERVRGVATLATASDLTDFCGDPSEFARACERAGVVGPEEINDSGQLARDVVGLDPLAAAALLPPRRLLFVHGSNDPIAPEQSARALVQAAGGHAELRIIQGAGHWLRADPRMFATLLGWLDRQH